MQSSSGFSWHTGLAIKKIGQNQCIVLPENASQLKETVLREFHTSPLGGHLGYHKLLYLVNTHFWWLHMSQDLQEFCHQCVLCQQTKDITQKPLSLLQPLEPPSKPFEQVTMDIITHLLVFSEFDVVFTIVDRFFKYVIFLPCSTSSTVVDLAQIFYDNIVCKFGMPVKIDSDRHNAFLSKFWKSLMKLLQCKVALSYGYHPQTDGQSERFHWSVEQILQCYVALNQKNWVQVLQKAEFALTLTVHAAHHQSPFVAVYGFEPTLPLDLTMTSLPSHPVWAVSDFVSSQQLCFKAIKLSLAKFN